MKALGEKLFFAFLTTLYPVTQLFWVLTLTGLTGLGWKDILIGCFLPLYGWYLIFIRWAEYGFINQ